MPWPHSKRSSELRDHDLGRIAVRKVRRPRALVIAVTATAIRQPHLTIPHTFYFPSPHFGR
jgi:hypothetical protein